MPTRREDPLLAVVRDEYAKIRGRTRGMSQPDHPSSTPRALTVSLLFIAVLALALNLRAAASSVGPLLAEIGDGMNFGGGILGLLTSLPGLIFGLLGLFAVQISKRFGMSATLLMSAVALVFGIGLRAWVDSSWLFILLSIIGLTGIAVANVMMPAWIKVHGRSHTVRLMTLYSVCVVGSGALGASVSAPLTEYLSTILNQENGWRATLSLWGLLGVLPIIVWWVVASRVGYDYPKAPGHGNSSKHIFRSPAAWAMTVFFGLQSMQAYVQFGWLPQIYRDAGVSPTEAGLLLAALATLGIVGSMLMPTVVDRAKHLWLWPLVFGTATAFGYLGLLWLPAEGRWLWVVLLGIGGMAFATSIALIPARSVDPHITARLSGFVQPVGYILAALGPLLVGVLQAATTNWTASLLFLAASAVLMAATGMLASRNVKVDDQL